MKGIFKSTLNASFSSPFLLPTILLCIADAFLNVDWRGLSSVLPQWQDMKGEIKMENKGNWNEVIEFTWDFNVWPFFCVSLCISNLSPLFPSSPLCHVSHVSIGNHSQISRAFVTIRVMDINDNAPEFATEYEAFLCENGKPGQVRKEMAHSSQAVIYLSCPRSSLLCLAPLPANLFSF